MKEMGFTILEVDEHSAELERNLKRLKFSKMKTNKFYQPITRDHYEDLVQQVKAIRLKNAHGIKKRYVINMNFLPHDYWSAAKEFCLWENEKK
jgi:hypothetical protein